MKELRFDELQEVNGGGWKEAGTAFVGTVAMGASPFICRYFPGQCYDWVSTNWDMIKDASKNSRKRKRK